MVFPSVLLSLVFMAAAFSLAAQERDVFPIDLAEAAQVFEEARSASARDGEATWGRTLYGPMLLVDPKTRFVVANQADGEGVLREQDGVFVGTLPDEEQIANTAYTWAGVTWTMLI